jgi:hypothetical protein
VPRQGRQRINISACTTEQGQQGPRRNPTMLRTKAGCSANCSLA